jgi:hypothetical protein
MSRGGTIGPARAGVRRGKVTKLEPWFNAMAAIRGHARRELLLGSIEVVSAAQR